jgi:biopolymer transport protein TolR
LSPRPLTISRGLSGWSPSRLAARQAAKRRPSLYPSINVVALTSVLLAILLLLMFGPTTVDQPRFVADRPKAEHATPQPGALREDAITVMVTREGFVLFRDTEISLGELPDLIRTAVRDGSERKVYLVADNRAKNGDVARVVDQIQLAGINNVVILTQEPRSIP